MARMLGEAFFTVYPDTTGFRTLLDTQIRKSIAGINPKIPIGADTKQAMANILGLQAEMKALGDKLSTLRVNADTKGAEASVAKLQASLLALSKRVATIVMSADPSKLNAQIADEEARLAKLRIQASNLNMDANTAKAAAKIAALEKQAATLRAGLNKLTSDVDINAALTKLYAIEAELKVLKNDAQAVKLAADNAAFNAAIDASVARVATLKAQAADIKLGADPAQLAAWNAELLALQAATEKLNTSTKGTAAIVTGGFWNFAILGIKGWHLALDGILEATIAVTGALIALGAGIAAISEPAKNIATHLQAVDQASAALGVDIPPLTGKFDALMKSMAPRTIELFGAGMTIIQSQAGGLLSRMEPVVNLFDTWAAKIALWVTQQHQFGAAITSGTEFLSQFGTIIGRVADAISNLLTKDPGLAHFLLDFLQGVAGLLDAFSKLPAPIVETALALHGVYLWTKVLAAAPLLGFAKALGVLSDEQVIAAKSALSFKSILGFFLTNPFGWATIAAAAIGLIAYQSTQASNSTKAFINNLDQGLSSLSGGDAILAISADIGQLNDQIAKTNVASELKNWDNLGNTFRSTGLDAQAFGADWLKAVQGITSGNVLSGLEAAGKAIKDLFVPGGGAARGAANDVSAYRGEIVKLTTEQDNLFKVTGALVTGENNLHLGTLSVSQAFGLMNIAGVKASDSVQLMWQKVKDLVTGYQNLSISGGILANSVNAISFATLQQQEKVSQLNSAWDAFFKTVSGGEAGFLSFAQQTTGLYATLTSSGLKLHESNGKVSASIASLGTAAKGGATSLTGLNSASINARQTFLQSADAANSEVDNLTLLANAAGLGEKGTRLLAQSVKDMVASLLPAASKSQALTAVLYALAQRGGYQGADSFKALSQWVGKTADPMKNLDGITTTLTVAAAGLTKDVQNLSMALGTTLNQAMAAAILQARGGQKVFDDFATSLKNGFTNSKQEQTAALALANQLVLLTGNTKDAHNEFDAFAQQMGISRQQADQLWQEIQGKLSPALTQQGQTILPQLKNQFTTFAEVGLNQTRTQADNLWSEVTSKLGPGLDALGNLAGGTAKAKFIDWAENGLKLTQTQATSLWQELVTLQNHINSLQGKNIKISMDGSGLYTITGTIIGASQGPGGSKNAAGGLAGGGYISMGTGPTADDVPAMLSKGELVVPAKMVKSGAVDHLRGKLPGFANGGSVSGSTANLLGNPGFVDTMGNQFQVTMQNSMISAMRTTLKGAEAAAVAAAKAAAAAAAAASINAAGVPNSSAEAALKAAAAKAGWTGAQWQALVNVEMREAGFSLTATNPSSGAYGMAQFINGPSEYATYGGNSTTAAGQAVAMVNYIKQRYGTPAAAWAHEQAYGWYKHGGLVTPTGHMISARHAMGGMVSYDNGGYLRPGATLAWNGTGRPEPVGSPGAALDTKIDKLIQLTASHVMLTRKLIDTTAAVPGGVGNAVGGAFSGASAAAGFRNRYVRGGA